MILLWDNRRISRSTTKEQWLAMDRWRRKTSKVLADEVRKQGENLAVYGTSHPELARQIADRLVNPPILLGPMFS